MADNKDMTMQKQATTIKQKPTQKQKKLLARHSHLPLSSANPKLYPNLSSPSLRSPDLLSSASASSPSPNSPIPCLPPRPPLKRKTPDPPTASTCSPPPLSNQHKKEKLLKVILKVPPLSSPSSHPPPLPSTASPLSRPSPPPSPHRRHHPAHHHHPSPAPSPSPSPLSPLSSPFHPTFFQKQNHLPKRQKLAAELQQDDNQEHLKQIKLTTPDPKQIRLAAPGPKQLVQDPHQKSHHLRLIQKRKDQKEQVDASSPDNQAQLTPELSRFKPREQKEYQEVQRASYFRKAEKNFNTPRQGENFSIIQQPNGACPSGSRGLQEQENSSYPSFAKSSEQVDQAEEVGQRDHSRTKRQETRQLDVGAILKRPYKHQQVGDQNIGFYPKIVKGDHHHCRHHQLKQTNHSLGNPNIQKPSSPQQAVKKLTHKFVQGPPHHGLHENHHNTIPPTKSPPLNNHAFAPFYSGSPKSDGPSLSASAISEEAQKPSKKRKLRSLLDKDCDEGLSTVNREDEQSEGVSQPAFTPPAESPVARPDPEDSTIQALPLASSSSKVAAADSSSSAPVLVPAKKLLTGILDKLQKKDKYGVFGEPVDPKEVPNYYDIIKYPMDFGTIRNRIKLAHYSSIELFETDIFLICNNAMEYNGKGTVYFRHARAIKDVAERILEELKVTGLVMEVDETTAVKRRVGGYGKGSEKLEACTHVGSPGEARVDMQEEFSGYFLRSVGGSDGRRFHPFDENRRYTYNNSLQGNDMLLNVISGDYSHVVPTGYQMDFSYGKSLAHFAGDLGPLVWKFAAEMIKKALPPGFPFGPGWVGEQEASGGLMVAPSAKHRSSNVPSTPKSVSGGAVIPCKNTPIENSCTNQASPKDGLTLQNGQANQGMEASVQPTYVRPPPPNRSLVVFGNPLHHERLDMPAELSRVLDNSVPDQQRSGQHNERSDVHNSKEAKPQHQYDSHVNEGSGRPDRSNVAVTRSGTQVNLNHSLGSQSYDVKASVNQASSMDAIKEENVLGREWVASSPSTRSNVALHYDPLQSSQGLGPSYSPLQPPSSARSWVNLQDIALVDSRQPNSSHPDSRGLVFPRNAIMPSHQMPIQQSSIRSQHPILNPVEGTQDSSVESPLSKRAALPYHDAILGEKSRNASEEREGASNNGMPANVASITLKAGFLPNRGLNVPQFESTIGRQTTVQDRAYVTRQNPISMQKKESASPGIPASNLIPALLTCNGVSRVQEDKRLQGWVAAQQPHSMAGKGVMDLQSKVSRSPEGVLETSSNSMNSPSVGLQSLKLQGVDKGQVYVAGHSKPNLNLPHFLQQQIHKGAHVPSQLGNGAHMPSQLSNGIHMPSQLGNGAHLHSQLSNGVHIPSQRLPIPPSNSKPPIARNTSSLDSAEIDSVRHVQIPTNRVIGLPHVGSSTWQHDSSPILSQGSHLPFALRPDLNVSLPAAKSPFEQPNGNEVQQPDLALQL